ncbi:hypothetical protein, partial [Vibrio vulnificus]|uniref:hypothetical protein n=1 Tax=Vibrio vulnificus TaxID=672 RepID=UPI000D483519
WLLFFLLECDSKLTHYHPNWLNFNSDNYPARGGDQKLLTPYQENVERSAREVELVHSRVKKQMKAELDEI